MGTRGLRIVFFRGRYFVYYNHWDSYPEGLGKDIVDSIPCDSEQYKVWLKSERERYTTLLMELDQVVMMTEDQIQSLLAAEKKDENEEHSEEQPRWKMIDKTLNELPAAFCSIETDLWIEWTYIIDLDKEIFSVNNWIHFDLRNIPRDRWIQAFEFQNNGGLVFSFGIAPEGRDRLEPPDYFEFVSDKRDALNATYKHYQSSIVGILDNYHPTMLQIVSMALLEQLSHVYAPPFHKTLPGSASTDFGFRETAFSVLSLAAGQFHFDQPDRYHGGYSKEDSNGYLIGRDVEKKPKFMPLFGSGCHMQSQPPGSAPTSSMYWFAGVLISLVPHSVLANDTEAAIAEVMTSEIAEGHQNFQAILFSIFKAVFFEITIVDGVTKIKRTEPVSIFDIDGADNDADNSDTPTEECDDEKCDDDECDDEEGEQEEVDGEEANDEEAEDEEGVDSVYDYIRHKYRGFIALQNFLSSATNRRLSRFGQGIFPVEVYDKIIACADRSTHEACSEVSRAFHDLCQRHTWFSDNLSIFSMDDWPRLPRSHTFHRRHGTRLDDFNTFTFRNETTRSLLRSKLHYQVPFGMSDRKNSVLFSPVFGSAERQSMMTQAQLRLRL